MPSPRMALPRAPDMKSSSGMRKSDRMATVTAEFVGSSPIKSGVAWPNGLSENLRSSRPVTSMVMPLGTELAG